MIKFHEENHEIFNFFIKVEKENDSYNVKALFPENQDIPDYIKHVDLFCFPYNQYIEDKEYQFYFCLTDSSKNLTYVYVSRKKTDAFCLISPFFHPRFFLEISLKLSEIVESRIPSACLKFLELKIFHEQMDWRAFNKNSANESELTKLDHYFNKISPSCVLSFLYQFIFCKLPIQYILITIVAMALDCRIIVVSSELSDISVAVFSLIALIYPLKWPGTFIPILPTSILTMLDAPFAYLIGIHSSASDAMISIDRYFVVNIDFHYCASVGMEDFPPNVLKYIDERADSIKKLINKYLPIFPFIQIQKQIRLFIRDLFGVVYGIENTNDFNQISQNFDKWKSVPSEEFQAIFSQTQFINGFISDIIYENNKEVFQAFWPNRTFIQIDSTASITQPRTQKHYGLNKNKKKSLSKEDLDQLQIKPCSNENEIKIKIDNEDENENEIEDKNNYETKKVESNISTNTNENGKAFDNSDNQIGVNEHKNITKTSDDLKNNDDHQNKHKMTNKNKVDSVRLATLNLKNLNSNYNSVLDDTNHANSSRKVKKRRYPKTRSQSVENKLLNKNNPYSTINTKSANEEPPPLPKKPVIPEIIDNDFIEAPDDNNLIPTKRKARQIPVPKKIPSKIPEIPLNKRSTFAPTPPNSPNGSQSSRVYIRKENTFSYNKNPNSGILLSPTRSTRNASESNNHQNEIKKVEISKRSSLAALHSDLADKKRNEEHTRRRKKKRRAQSNVTEKDNNYQLQKDKQGTSSNESIEKEINKNEENNHQKNALNHQNIFSTPKENKNNEIIDDNLNINITSQSKQNTNIKNNEDKINSSEEEEEEKQISKEQPITPTNKPIRRPLPGSMNAKNRIGSLQLNKINNNIRPYRQLTPRYYRNIRNSCLPNRNLSPSQKISKNGSMIPNRPKFINFSDSSDYEYNYSYSNDQTNDSNENKSTNTTKENNNEAHSLSARISSHSVQRNNMPISQSQRKRKTSFETPKTLSIQSSNTMANGNASDGNNEITLSRSKKFVSRPRITPNSRNNVSKPIFKFSSSSDYYEYD